MTAELRYSAKCHAAWARGLDPTGSNPAQADVYIRVERWYYLNGPDVWQISSLYYVPFTNGAYTAMVSTASAERVRVGITVHATSPSEAYYSVYKELI